MYSKVVFVHAMKLLGGRELELQSFLTLAGE